MPDEDSTGNGNEEDTDSEVLSFDMSDRDDTGTVDDEPHLTPSEPDAGFDGWLDGEDPYRELSEEEEEEEAEDAAEEVADWLAFARGEGEEEEEEEEGEDVSSSEEPEGGETDDTSEFGLPPSPEDTGEIPIVGEEPPSAPVSSPNGEGVERSEADEAVAGLPPMVGETEDDTGEIPALEDVSEPDDLDVVVEMEAVDASADFEAEDVEADEDGDEDEEPPPIDDFTAEDYLDSATQDHAELAAAVAAADEESSEQVALSADIPGLESSIVGFDDVVEEEEVEEEETEPEGTSNLMLRVGTAVALVGALLLSLLWRPALIVFVLAVFIVAAGEFYSALIQRRYKPMSLFGFLGIAGAALGSAAFGVVAIPVSLALMTTVLLLFNAVSPRRDQPAANFSLTVLVAAWIGGLGAFAFDIIAAEDFQVLVLVLVATVALVDISAYFVGRSIGRRPMAPVISPKKTIEGLVAGTLTGLAVGAGVSYLVDSIDLPAGLLLGAVVAVFAPIGDLAVSVVKRSLDIKDMGSILPGHGGLLDRIDAVIAVIPAVWVVLTWLALI